MKGRTSAWVRVCNAAASISPWSTWQLLHFCLSAKHQVSTHLSWVLNHAKEETSSLSWQSAGPWKGRGFPGTGGMRWLWAGQEGAIIPFFDGYSEQRHHTSSPSKDREQRSSLEMAILMFVFFSFIFFSFIFLQQLLACSSPCAVPGRTRLWTTSSLPRQVFPSPQILFILQLMLISARVLVGKQQSCSLCWDSGRQEALVAALSFCTPPFLNYFCVSKLYFTRMGFQYKFS